MKSTGLNTTTLVLVTVLVLAGVYWYFSGSGEDKVLSLINTENSAQTKFQLLVSELRPISFDTSIFSDSRFNALQNMTVPIAPESIGRFDPFATVSGTQDIQ